MKMIWDFWRNVLFLKFFFKIAIYIFNWIQSRQSKMVNTFIEEKMKTLIKEIFQEKFKKQAENITNWISGNFQLMMQKNIWVEKLNYWPEKIPWVYAKWLRGKGWQLGKKNSDIQEIYEYQINSNYVQDKLIHLVKII